MNINKLLQKPNWKRRMPDGQYKQVTQEQFIDELFPSAHPINSPMYKAMRPIWEYDDKKGEMVIKDWDDVERVTYGLEQIVMRSLPAHMFGNGVWFGNEGERSNDKLVKQIKSHWNIAGMNDAMLNWFHDAGAVGDAGLYMYVDEGRIAYKVFSLLNDDIIAKPNKNTFSRKFKIGSVDVVEIYGKEEITVWVNGSVLELGTDEKEDLLLGLGLETMTAGKQSADGSWVCINTQKHGAGRCPVDYLRFKDVFYGAGVDIRERIERLLSYWGDSDNAFGMPILVLNSAPLSLPPMGAGNKTLAFTNTDGKANLLTPPDASTSFTLDLKENKKNYCDVVGVVIIDQESLKGGDYSGAYLNNLYFPVVQWCLGKRAEIRHNVNNVIKIFTGYVSAIEKDSISYEGLKMSWTIEPHTPKNKMEEATILSMATSAKFTSRATAAGEADWNSPFEDDMLKEQDAYDDAREIAKKEAPTEEVVVGKKVKAEPIPVDNRLKQK